MSSSSAGARPLTVLPAGVHHSPRRTTPKEPSPSFSKSDRSRSRIRQVSECWPPVSGGGGVGGLRKVLWGWGGSSDSGRLPLNTCGAQRGVGWGARRHAGGPQIFLPAGGHGSPRFPHPIRVISEGMGSVPAPVHSWGCWHLRGGRGRHVAGVGGGISRPGSRLSRLLLKAHPGPGSAQMSHERERPRPSAQLASTRAFWGREVPGGQHPWGTSPGAHPGVPASVLRGTGAGRGMENGDAAHGAG